MKLYFVNFTYRHGKLESAFNFPSLVSFITWRPRLWYSTNRVFGRIWYMSFVIVSRIGLGDCAGITFDIEVKMLGRNAKYSCAQSAGQVQVVSLILLWVDILFSATWQVIAMLGMNDRLHSLTMVPRQHVWYTSYVFIVWCCVSCSMPVFDVKSGVSSKNMQANIVDLLLEASYGKPHTLSKPCSLERGKIAVSIYYLVSCEGCSRGVFFQQSKRYQCCSVHCGKLLCFKHVSWQVSNDYNFGVPQKLFIFALKRTSPVRIMEHVVNMDWG